jgi:hypothetical protein
MNHFISIVELIGSIVGLVLGPVSIVATIYSPEIKTAIQAKISNMFSNQIERMTARIRLIDRCHSDPGALIAYLGLRIAYLIANIGVLLVMTFLSAAMSLSASIYHSPRLLQFMQFDFGIPPLYEGIIVILIGYLVLIIIIYSWFDTFSFCSSLLRYQHSRADLINDVLQKMKKTGMTDEDAEKALYSNIQRK